MRRTLLLAGSALAVAMASTGASAQNNDLAIQQVSAGNFAAASQVGARNETFIRQSDIGNGASIPVQQGNDNDVLVIQETRRNFFEASTTGGGHNNNRIVALQNTGNGNLMIGPNSSGGNSGPFRNSTFAGVQAGAGNVIDGGGDRSGNTGFGPYTTAFQVDLLTVDSPQVDPGLIPAGLPGGGQSGHAIFSGNQNFVALGQLGNQNRLGVIVDGDRNTIAGNQGSLTQVDMNQEVTDASGATQDFFDRPTTGGDIIDMPPAGGAMTWALNGFATQEGFGNVAHLVQFGDDNTIAFNQLSNGNTAQIYQQGSWNGVLAVQN